MNEFMEKARKAVELESAVPAHELYVVWFCKTLQNWKALISTDWVNGLYWEVTYNGDKKEMYVDRYEKVTNTCIPDE